jgi:hypothetical protein
VEGLPKNGRENIYSIILGYAGVNRGRCSKSVLSNKTQSKDSSQTRFS